MDFNAELLHFAHHYGFAPKACPPYAAWVKGKVERPVDYIRESFWRGYEFSDFDTANRDLFAIGWTRWPTAASTALTGNRSIERWQQEKARVRARFPPPTTIPR